MADITMSFEVEKIIYKEKFSDGVWYLVKWAPNVPGEKYDWVHETDMECAELIEEFENLDGVGILECESEFLQAKIDELQKEKTKGKKNFKS